MARAGDDDVMTRAVWPACAAVLMLMSAGCAREMPPSVEAASEAEAERAAQQSQPATGTATGRAADETDTAATEPGRERAERTDRADYRVHSR